MSATEHVMRMIDRNKLADAASNIRRKCAGACVSAFGLPLIPRSPSTPNLTLFHHHLARIYAYKYINMPQLIHLPLNQRSRQCIANCFELRCFIRFARSTFILLHYSVMLFRDIRDNFSFSSRLVEKVLSDLISRQFNPR